MQEAVRDAAEIVVGIARYDDIPAPEPEFLPDQPTGAVTRSTNKNSIVRGCHLILSEDISLKPVHHRGIFATSGPR
ncbi:IS4 transposase [Natrarchaeobaculum sulfurireducens]|uniref:IS4 transposase n=1 Tax=Natrarchaeobaculum sulfurireducens TaxID=2044521 RepID=A0A346PLG7_9EURY|nr:IS4 transposase [Natrarchaeobaculum sulfurireducens]